MGNIVSQFEKQAKQKSNCPLLNTSLAKLRDYHGSFKAICESFSLDLTEFEQIFGSNESSFVIWDTDDNGLIDALELFSGLIIFADAKFEDRIRFLFDLFDFNELQSISAVDLEFMIHSCLSSTFKVYSIGDDIKEEEIANFVEETFIEDSRLNISQLLKWASKSEEIQRFFKIVRKDTFSQKGDYDSVDDSGLTKTDKNEKTE